ncbi:tetratricopeptide repeat protein [Phyllobacterium sp. UNC302MFCol5.2]|uniref:tetratricopeptide repeat protein n=1 Tax=Phyllobacterium sp. UNC302MFCol5.2 TaxID=1449065 RepID=UPI0004840E60|nr:tetratricopeptide repeat protein [Phyllobacterium sp. UNC302MFCol5.2]
MPTAKQYCHDARQQELTPAGNIEAARLYGLAIKADDGYLPAYAECSYVHLRAYQNNWPPQLRSNDSITEAARLADKAVALSNDPDSDWHFDFRGLWYRAMVSWNAGDFKRSFDEYDAARSRITDPVWKIKNTAELDADKAEALIYYGNPGAALDLILGAEASYPEFPWWLKWLAARAHYQLGNYTEAINEINSIDPAKKPNDVLLILAASEARRGNIDDAKTIMAEFSKNDPDWTVKLSESYIYGDPDQKTHWIEGLRMAELREK